MGRRNGKLPNENSENVPPKTCPKCFGIIARGVMHPCSKAEKRSNLAEILKSSSFKTRGKVTSASLKGKIKSDNICYVLSTPFSSDICQTVGASSSGGNLQLPTGGKPLTVTVGGQVEAKKRKYTAENLPKLQASRNFSDNDMR